MTPKQRMLAALERRQADHLPVTTHHIMQYYLDTFDDPGWVHEFLRILQRRKKAYLQSMAGARIDLVELGGGSASSTIISPRIFQQKREFPDILGEVIREFAFSSLLHGQHSLRRYTAHRAGLLRRRH